MAKSDLLKEAIADARTVKETALANAKIALQEAFAPRLENMLSARMMEELDDEEPMDAPIEGEENLDAPMDDEMGAEEDGDIDWTDNHISFNAGGQDYEAEINNPMGDEAEMGAEVGAGMEGEFGAEEMPEENPEDEYSEEDKDLDLESIIRELEGDLDQPEEEPIDEPMMHEGEEADESEDDNIDEIIEAILREEEDCDDEESMEAELKETKAELEEAYKTVKQMQSVIQEVNLLNAKLLYTNKLFRNFDLNEGQKMKVLENFDRAANTREVKLVFSTLAESFVKPVKKRVVKESYASKPVASTNPKSNTPILTEGFAQAERWKKLAGLL
jgi:hypothetical protein